eukprot:768754-Hanusia_phi.AAC.6
MKRVIFDAKLEHDCVKNYKVEKLIKAKPLDNLEMLQWCKRFFDLNYSVSPLFCLSISFDFEKGERIQSDGASSGQGKKISPLTVNTSEQVSPSHVRRLHFLLHVDLRLQPTTQKPIRPASAGLQRSPGDVLLCLHARGLMTGQLKFLGLKSNFKQGDDNEQSENSGPELTRRVKSGDDCATEGGVRGRSRTKGYSSSPSIAFLSSKRAQESIVTKTLAILYAKDNEVSKLSFIPRYPSCQAPPTSLLEEHADVKTRGGWEDCLTLAAGRGRIWGRRRIWRASGSHKGRVLTG